MPLTQLIYTSTPFGFDDHTLNAILLTARSLNARDGVTGALICRDDLFLQMLEGPTEAVVAAYARILRDDRHVDVVKLRSAEIEQRMFPDWAMRHDPVRSWMWTPDDVHAGAVAKASTPELLAIFGRVAAEPIDDA